MADSVKDKDTIEYKMKRRKLSANIAFTVVFICLGIFVAVQTISQRAATERELLEKEETFRSYEAQVEALEAEVAVLSGEISEMSAEYDSKMEQLAESDNDFFRILEFYNASISKYSFYAGTSEVIGNGIEISIDDGNPTSGTVSNFLLVHDSTLLNIINALRDAGAQAISVNGERIVSDTEILCMGTGIKVNDRKIFAPFSIKAIGNSEILYSDFVNSKVYKNIVTADLLVNVNVSESVRISGFSGLTDSSVKYLKDSANE